MNQRTLLYQFSSRTNNQHCEFRRRFIFPIWYLFKILFFSTHFPWPYKFKVFLLQLFGSRIGKSVVIKPRVNIHLPWNLDIGDYSWIGEGVEIYNFAFVKIGRNVCISQRGFICAAGHNFRDPSFSYRHFPISIDDGAWIQACVVLCGGVEVGAEAVVEAGAVLRSDAEENTVYSGNPAQRSGTRWK